MVLTTIFSYLSDSTKCRRFLYFPAQALYLSLGHASVYERRAIFKSSSINFMPNLTPAKTQVLTLIC